jgi:hypothetical protein
MAPELLERHLSGPAHKPVFNLRRMYGANACGSATDG